MIQVKMGQHHYGDIRWLQAQLGQTAEKLLFRCGHIRVGAKGFRPGTGHALWIAAGVKEYISDGGIHQEGVNGDGKGLGAALGGVCYRVVPHHDDLAEIKHIEFHEAFLPCRNFEKFPKTLQKSFRELSPF